MTSDANPFPPRLHVIFASAKNIGVVFRRGPSKQVATFLWDRRKDEFKLGQWLKGRIYERRADLSPDGKRMIYFAMNGKWDSETRGSWTAVSQPPYLKAFDLYAKGDCWEGGGLFVSNDRYWLNDRYFQKENALMLTSGMACDHNARPEKFFGSECTGVYYPRLLRDGWRLTSTSERGEWNAQTVFEKPLTKNWILRKIAHEQVNAPKGKGCYWDEHEIENTQSGVVIPCPDWEWADWDQKALVWAEFGKIYRASLSGFSALKSRKLLHDFTKYSFESIEAPY